MSLAPGKAPTEQVLAGFGESGPARRLAGGRGTTWQAGDTVLKPVPDPPLAAWAAQVLSEIVVDGRLRLPRPVRAATGWVVDGWAGYHWVEGQPDDRRLAEIAAAGAAFHQALRDVPRPDLLNRCEDPWRTGDRSAWGELPVPDRGAHAQDLHRLAAARRPLRLRSQLIHPDLAGNVLFAPGLPPAVIDWPPFWRPPKWGSAIAAVDGLDTGRVSLAAVLALGTGADWIQLLLRAEMYRLATKNEAQLRGLALIDDKVHHAATVATLCRLAIA